jgi:hypothetical protein
MEDAAKRGLLSAAVRTVAYVQNDLIPAALPQPVDRGTYRAGWRAEPRPGGAAVVCDAPHAALIEGGVRAANVKPGRAMVQAIAEWARRKGLGGRMVQGKGGTTRFKKATEDEATQIAWAIVRSMQKRGIFDGGRGLGIFKKAKEQIPRFIREEVARELRKVGRGA